MNNKPLLNQQHTSPGNFFYHFVQTEATEVVNCEKHLFCTEIRTKLHFVVNANTNNKIKHKSGYLCKIGKSDVII